MLNVKQIIHKLHPDCKNIVVSSAIIRTDKQEANIILKKYNNILKQEEKKVIFHNNITPSHLNKDGLHLNFNGSTVLAGNLLSRIRMFWCTMDSNEQISLSNEQHENDRINSSNYNSSINDTQAIQTIVLLILFWETFV